MIVSNTFMLTVNPRKNATIKHTVTCNIAIGSSGSVYPKIKLLDVSGEVNNRSINELVLSFAISIPEKSEMNESPKTAIPGARWSITNSSTGILDCIADKSRSKTIGKPIPKAKLSRSLKISLLFREAKAKVFISVHPLLQQLK
jgi:hypothetical protein